MLEKIKQRIPVDSILSGVTKFSNFKFIKAMKDGLAITMPFTIIGSFFLILSNFPYQPVADQLAAWGWSPYLSAASGATFDMMAAYAVIALTIQWVKNEGFDGVPAGLLAFAAFEILLPQSVDVLNAKGKVVGTATGVIDKAWTGGQGLIGAILIATVVGMVYSWFLKHKITIKMPEMVPPAIAGAFTAIIPGAAIIVGSVLVRLFFNVTTGETMMQTIYKYLQVPLQGMTDSFAGLMIFILLMNGFWAFGVHGSMIVNGLLGPILQANTLDNARLAKQGAEALQAHGHIFIQPLIDQFVNVSGAGMMFGLVMYLLFFSKSQAFRKLGKLSALPMSFQIVEPILFGLPIVFNPIMIVPFILQPLLSGGLTYMMIAIGVLPKLTGVMLPWTTPAVISGYLVGGIPYMLWQILMLVMSFFVYFPFARISDRMNLEREEGKLSAE